MKVVHVINGLRVGGAERLTVDLAVRQKRAGIDVRILSLSTGDPALRATAEAGGVAVREMEVASPYAVHATLPAVAHAVRDADVAHAHLFPSQLYVAVAPGRAARVTTEHSTHYRRRNLLVFRRVDRWMYPRFDRIACISRAVHDTMTGLATLRDDRVHVVPNGVDLEALDAAPPIARRTLVPGLPDHAVLLLSVGRLVGAKDHATQLRALARLPARVHLALVGEGPLRRELEALRDRLDLRARAHFLGNREDVPGILKAADAFVTTSRWEGFGLALLEAMAVGLPVVASDIPGLSEVRGSAGIGFTPGDEAALARAVDVLLEPEARVDQTARSRRQAKRYDVARMVEAYERIYDEARAMRACG